jgi:hypothetical protein
VDLVLKLLRAGAQLKQPWRCLARNGQPLYAVRHDEPTAFHSYPPRTSFVRPPSFRGIHSVLTRLQDCGDVVANENSFHSTVPVYGKDPSRNSKSAFCGQRRPLQTRSCESESFASISLLTTVFGYLQTNQRQLTFHIAHQNKQPA